MNEHSQSNAATDTGTSVVIGFVLGALVGAGLALLLAPGTGQETRRRLANTGGRMGAAARDAFERAGDTASDLRQGAASALRAGREALEHGRGSHEPNAAPRTDLKM